MGRQATIRDKGGYWTTDVGGRTKRFGRVDQVPHADALKAFYQYVAALKAQVPQEGPQVPQERPTVKVLTDAFIEWLEAHRPARDAVDRGLHLRKFTALYGDLKADKITAQHMREFLYSLKGHAPDYQRKHQISVGMLFRWGVRLKRLPEGFAPFKEVERVKVPHRIVTEADLITPQEYAALLEVADADLAGVPQGNRGPRRRLREEWRTGEENPARGFRDMLVCYHGTGARTHELVVARVGDWQPRVRAIVLGKHKTMGRVRQPKARTITPDSAAIEILERLTHGRDKGEFIFIDHRSGTPWTTGSVDLRFQKIRKLAGVRDTITPYSFRHLFISQLLQAGVDVYMAAKMSGNSVAVIESTYGHLRNADFRSAVDRLEAFRRGS